MTTAICPACDRNIKVPNRPRIGQKLVCPHCDTDLEVIEVDPLELDWAYEDLDDFDEDDENY